MAERITAAVSVADTSDTTNTGGTGELSRNAGRPRNGNADRPRDGAPSGNGPAGTPDGERSDESEDGPASEAHGSPETPAPEPDGAPDAGETTQVLNEVDAPHEGGDGTPRDAPSPASPNGSRSRGGGGTSGNRRRGSRKRSTSRTAPQRSATARSTPAQRATARTTGATAMGPAVDTEDGPADGSPDAPTVEVPPTPDLTQDTAPLDAPFDAPVSPADVPAEGTPESAAESAVREGDAAVGDRESTRVGADNDPVDAVEDTLVADTVTGPPAPATGLDDTVVGAEEETAPIDPTTAAGRLDVTARMTPATADTALLEPDASSDAPPAAPAEADAAPPPAGDRTASPDTQDQTPAGSDAPAPTDASPDTSAKARKPRKGERAQEKTGKPPTAEEPPEAERADAEAEETAPERDQEPKEQAPERKGAQRPQRDEGKPRKSKSKSGNRDPHSGHKLAGRYRLEECVTRVDGFSSWRAVDEKLRRAVGVHLLPRDHPQARSVLAAARSAALLMDPRFVQVLDAVEEGELVYVVHEWLPDATSLTTLLASGPLEPHESYQLVKQLSQALAAAHREGLAHLRLTPTSVLRTGAGQYRIRGLAVNAALRGLSSDTPQRTDTEAIGALLYASLTGRWPYQEDGYGMSGFGQLTGEDLPAPDQVRAGVHRGLAELAMRALVNDGATASREEQPCATPEELAHAVSEMPRIRPPEPSFANPRYQPTSYQQGAFSPSGPHPKDTAAPPALPGRTGRILKWTVSALLIAALGLGSWQVADTLMNGDGTHSGSSGETGDSSDSAKKQKLKIVNAKDFDPSPGNGEENASQVPKAYDGDRGTQWTTSEYYRRPDLGGLKPGVGLVLDLGKTREVSTLRVDFVGRTKAEFRVAPVSTQGMPTGLDGFGKALDKGSGERLNLKASEPVETRYVLVWLTELPSSENGNYRGRISEVSVLG